MPDKEPARNVDGMPVSGDDLRRRLRERADLLRHLRDFMAGRGVMEVEVPMLLEIPNWDPGVASFSVSLPRGGYVYLHSSPESTMKRLLAAGSGPIYSLGKVFRRDERGQWHEPEFTMLEWYRPGYDRRRLQEEVCALLESLGLPAPGALSYRQAFIRYAGVDPHTAPTGTLAAAARQYGSKRETGTAAVPDCRDRSEWLDWLLAFVVVPALGSAPFFLCDYPADEPAQATLLPEPPPRADRFELFIQGMEIANGCSELRDADELIRRTDQANERRRRDGRPDLPLDHGVLTALRRGLPACAGVALGVDRLLLARRGGGRLRDIAPFFGWNGPPETDPGPS